MYANMCVRVYTWLETFVFGVHMVGDYDGQFFIQRAAIYSLNESQSSQTTDLCTKSVIHDD